MKHKRSFLTTTDLTVAEITRLFRLTQQIKKHPISQRLKQKSVGMIFQQSSTRTRISFEVGMTQLGGHALYLNQNDLKLATGETIGDTARVLSRYVDGIVGRIFEHADLVELDKHSRVPVINAMTNDFHPCQALADLFTVLEKKRRLKGLSVAFVGDGDNNVTNSMLILCAQLGLNFSLASPPEYSLTTSVLSEAKALAKVSGSHIRVETDPHIAVNNADVVATDIWTSPGKPDVQKRLRVFPLYQLNQELLSHAKADAIVLHCLPAHRGEEITDEVIDGIHSAVWDEAENRLHIQKALLLYLLEKK